MQTQKFKGDDFELQMESAAAPAFDLTELALDAMYDGCYEAHDWLLALYDSGRMPFSDRVPRDSFPAFFQRALENFPFTGTFEAYLFILKSIFGGATEVLFEVPGDGKISILVNAEAAIEFEAEAREYAGGIFQTYQLVTSDGDVIAFRGISGIDSEEELNQLLAELIPVGIFPDIALTFFTVDEFEAEDPAGSFYSVIDHDGNQIIFFET